MPGVSLSSIKPWPVDLACCDCCPIVFAYMQVKKIVDYTFASQNDYEEALDYYNNVYLPSDPPEPIAPPPLPPEDFIASFLAQYDDVDWDAIDVEIDGGVAAYQNTYVVTTEDDAVHYAYIRKCIYRPVFRVLRRWKGTFNEDGDREYEDGAWQTCVTSFEAEYIPVRSSYVDGDIVCASQTLGTKITFSEWVRLEDQPDEDELLETDEYRYITLEDYEELTAADDEAIEIRSHVFASDDGGSISIGVISEMLVMEGFWSYSDNRTTLYLREDGGSEFQELELVGVQWGGSSNITSPGFNQGHLVDFRDRREDPLLRDGKTLSVPADSDLVKDALDIYFDEYHEYLEDFEVYTQDYLDWVAGGSEGDPPEEPLAPDRGSIRDTNLGINASFTIQTVTSYTRKDVIVIFGPFELTECQALVPESGEGDDVIPAHYEGNGEYPVPPWKAKIIFKTAGGETEESHNLSVMSTLDEEGEVIGKYLYKKVIFYGNTDEKIIKSARVVWED